MESESRKLAAIMFTDMVGYSALAQKNEQLSMELLDKHREILRPLFPKHHGKEIKTIGDAFLVEFGSALDSVNCSIAIQKELQNYNRNSSNDRQILIRIGIHIGDVVYRNGDIYGDGVNISSRIEPLADPGGICISENVAREVKNKLEFPLQKMGMHDLKNIESPVEIFQISLDKSYSENSSTLEKNKLAVLPFQNISPEKESDYFSDGLTEELIMHLSGIKELKVVSRTTTMHYKNSQEDMASIGRELKARYILEGSVRRHNDDLRITAQLIDVKTDSHLWAETYRGNMADVFDIQENVSKEIVQALRLQLSPTEEVALSKRATLNSEAFDLNLRAREFLYRLTKNYLLTSIDLFKNAIELDARYAPAYAGLGEAYAFMYQFFGREASLLDKAMEASLKALMYEPTSSEAYSALGLIYYQRKNYDEALHSIEKAIELDPENYFAYWTLGRIYHIMDRDADAAEQFNKVLEFNPDFQTAFGDLEMVYEKLGEKEKLDELIERALKFYPPYLMRHPDDARAHIFFAFVLQKVDRTEDAKAQMAKAIERSPDDSLMMYNAACFYSIIGDKDRAVELLQRSVAKGQQDIEYIKRDPDLDNIRDEPGYLELVSGK